MADKFQPTLSAKLRKDKGPAIYEKDRATVTWPKLASAKLDGIRVWNPHGDGLFSRTMKLIPNRNMQSTFGTDLLAGIDGEGIHGLPYQPPEDDITVMQRASSAIMSRDGPADVTLYAFDLYTDLDWTYEKRLEVLSDIVSGHPQVQVVEQRLVNSWDEAEESFDYFRSLGYEGLMLRDPLATYRLGRPSLRENLLIKLKASDDAEATIVGFLELKSNQNEQLLDERGYAKRSSHKENQVPMNTLGAFICQNEELWPGETFKIGTGIGLTAAFRQHIWDNRESYLGKTINFKYDELRSFQKPSIPSFRGFREDL